MTLGTMDTPSDTGYDGKDSINIPRAAGPFNRPTNLAIGPKGDIYISDGYGNCRVHRYTAGGELKQSWGVSGTGPGQFHLLRDGSASGIVAGRNALPAVQRPEDQIEVLARGRP